MELLIQGLAAMLTAQNILFIFFGTALGIIFGAIPGLTATMAVVLCLPLTFGMNPLSGMALLIGLYIGGISGGLISAICSISPVPRLPLPPRLMAIPWRSVVKREKPWALELYLRLSAVLSVFWC